MSTPIDLSTIELLNFAERHFDPTFAGTKITTETPESFMTKFVYRCVDIHDGFAPFCKVLTLRNFTECMSGMARITDDNRGKLQGAWRVRREGEAEYWATWFNAVDVDPEKAKYLHVIVYNREQLEAEGITLPEGKEWGIASINAEQVPVPVPMHPETMRRNRAGIEAGGNGHQHTDDEIEAAEAYHSQWANVGGE
jgi:hypothetical protein